MSNNESSLYRKILSGNFLDVLDSSETPDFSSLLKKHEYESLLGEKRTANLCKMDSRRFFYTWTNGLDIWMRLLEQIEKIPSNKLRSPHDKRLPFAFAILLTGSFECKEHPLRTEIMEKLVSMRPDLITSRIMLPSHALGRVWDGRNSTAVWSLISGSQEHTLWSKVWMERVVNERLPPTWLLPILLNGVIKGNIHMDEEARTLIKLIPNEIREEFVSFFPQVVRKDHLKNKSFINPIEKAKESVKIWQHLDCSTLSLEAQCSFALYCYLDLTKVSNIMKTPSVQKYIEASAILGEAGIPAPNQNLPKVNFQSEFLASWDNSFLHRETRERTLVKRNTRRL